MAPEFKIIVAGLVALLALGSCASASKPHEEELVPDRVTEDLVDPPLDPSETRGAPPGSLPESEPADGLAHRPPPPGDYIYRGSGNTPFGYADIEFTVTVGRADVLEDGSLATRVRWRDPHGGYRVFDYRWQRDGLYQTATRSSDASTCRYDPALLLIKFPLTVGDKWSYSGSCGSRSIEYTYFLLRTEVLALPEDDERVSAYVIERSEKSGDRRETWYAPEIRHQVRFVNYAKLHGRTLKMVEELLSSKPT